MTTIDHQPYVMLVYGLLFGFSSATTALEGKQVKNVSICDSTDALYEVIGNNEVVIVDKLVKKKIEVSFHRLLLLVFLFYLFYLFDLS